MGRCHVDDAAPAFAAVGSLHGGQCQAGGVKGAGQIDGNDGVPLFNREVFDSCDVLYACVVDQNIDLAKLGGGVRHHVCNLRRFAHVCAVVGDFDPMRSACGGNFSLGRVHIAKAVHDDVGALRRQRLGDPQANAAG